MIIRSLTELPGGSADDGSGEPRVHGDHQVHGAPLEQVDRLVRGVAPGPGHNNASNREISLTTL